MQQIGNAGSGILNSLYVAFNSFMAFIPALFGALLVLVIGWFVAGFVARLLEKGLEQLGFERAIARSGVQEVIGRGGTGLTVSHVVGQLFKWMILLVFIQAAANILGMPQVTAILSSIALFIPKLVVALGIVVIGSMAASFLAKLVHASLSKAKVENPAIFATMTRYAVTGFAVIAALSQLEIAPTIINSLFIALIGSIGLAVGLAFGLGGREVAGELTRKWFDRGQGILSRSSGPAPVQALREGSDPARRTGT